MQNIFKKIGSPLTLSKEIELKIEGAIRQKKLQVGQRLPSEKELCAMFGVSRTALREALRMLSARGLVTIRKGDGIYVSDYSAFHASKPMSLYLELKFDKSYVLHLAHIRQMIEPQIAMLAATNRTEDDLINLENNLKEFNKEDNDFKKIASLDLEFHLKIAKASANPLIPLVMDPLYSLLPKIKTLIVEKVKHRNSNNAIYYHQKIFDKIKIQDEQGAFEMMKQHLEIAEKDAKALLKTLEQDEDIF